ncbi:MAG: hypothetical protein H7831_08870 [Magnetococcus sp. WYHC-3]
MTEKESGFHKEMRRIYHEAKNAGYDGKYFIRMVNEHGGLAAAKRLLSQNKVHDGLVNLFVIGRLDLSMEHLVVDPKW